MDAVAEVDHGRIIGGDVVGALGGGTCILAAGLLVITAARPAAPDAPAAPAPSR